MLDVGDSAWGIRPIFVSGRDRKVLPPAREGRGPEGTDRKATYLPAGASR